MEFEKILTLALENLKENSVYQLLQSDMDFQKESQDESSAEESYIQLDLTEKQRQVCDQLLDCRDSQNIDYSNCSYVAGLYDAFRIMAVLFPQKWNMEQVRQILYENSKGFAMWELQGPWKNFILPAQKCA